MSVLVGVAAVVATTIFAFVQMRRDEAQLVTAPAGQWQSHSASWQKLVFIARGPRAYYLGGSTRHDRVYEQRLNEFVA